MSRYHVPLSLCPIVPMSHCPYVPKKHIATLDHQIHQQVLEGLLLAASLRRMIRTHLSKCVNLPILFGVRLTIIGSARNVCVQGMRSSSYAKRRQRDDDAFYYCSKVEMRTHFLNLYQSELSWLVSSLVLALHSDASAP